MQPTDLGSYGKHLSLLGADSRATTVNGSGVDVRDYDACVLILDSEAGTGSSPTLDVKIQESADNSTFTDVSGATFTQVTDAAAAFEEMDLSLRGLKRYIRAVATIGGSSPAFVCAVSGFFGGKQYMPAT